MDFFQIVGLLRDIVIILVALIWIVAGVLMAAIAFLGWRFARSLPNRAEALIVPAREMVGQARQVVDSAGDSARTAQKTVSFISDRAVMPTIVVISAVAGVRRFIEVLFQGRERDESGEAA